MNAHAIELSGIEKTFTVYRKRGGTTLRRVRSTMRAVDDVSFTICAREETTCCFVGAGAADARADDQRELGFPVDGVGVGWEHDVVVRADERLAELGEQRGVRGELVAHLEDVAPVVQALAEDLARVRDDGRVVGGRGVVGRARLARLVAAREQLTDVACGELDEGVAVDAHGAGSCFGSDRRPAHVATITVTPPWLDRCMFDVLVDEFRTHSTEWLRRDARGVGLAAAEPAHAEELAVLRVLDERGQVDCSMGSQGESARAVRDKVETARALESLPAIASVAMEGGFSDEQLSSVVQVADEESDREWARRAPNVDPLELSRMARKVSKPTAEDSRARFAARELRMWRARGSAMLQFRGQLPDDLGVRFEAEIYRRTEQMKVKGEPWAPFEQRAADALMSLCDPVAADDDDTPTLAPLAGIQAAVPLHGPAEIAGIPIADSSVGAVAGERVDHAGARRRRRCGDGDRAGGAGDLGEAAPGGVAARPRGVGSRGVLGGAGCRSTICCPGVGTAPTRSRTWPASAPRIIDC